MRLLYPKSRSQADPCQSGWRNAACNRPPSKTGHGPRPRGSEPPTQVAGQICELRPEGPPLATGANLVLSRRTIISAIHLIPNDGEVRLRGRRRIRFPREAYRGNADLRLKLGSGTVAFHPELLLGIVIHDSFVGRPPYHPEAHHGRRTHGIEGRPLRLINDRDIFHL